MQRKHKTPTATEFYHVLCYINVQKNFLKIWWQCMQDQKLMVFCLLTHSNSFNQNWIETSHHQQLWSLPCLKEQTSFTWRVDEHCTVYGKPSSLFLISIFKSSYSYKRNLVNPMTNPRPIRQEDSFFISHVNLKL